MLRAAKQSGWGGRIFLFALVMLACAAPVEAGVGWFAGVGGGQAKMKSFRLPTTSLDDKEPAPTIFGGYQFHTYFATSAGYLDLGEYHAEGPSFGGYRQDLNVNGFLVSGIGILPVGYRMAVIGTVGAYRWSVDFHSSDPIDPSISRSDSGVSPVLGAGLNYDVHRESYTMLFLTWQHFSKVGDRHTVEHENDYDLLLAGATYHFGQ